jgi:hypothetical protein
MAFTDSNKLKTAAFCGLFCEACGLYLATKENGEKLSKIAERFKLPPEQVKCEGCRSDKLSPYCSTCKMKECASRKKINFCSECEEYPCQLVLDFRSQPNVAHRLEIENSLQRIKEIGYTAWYEEMVQHYSCKQCGAINCAYDAYCRNCANTPANAYVELHSEEIKKILSSSQKKD